jgi:hypothetical protein
LVAPVVSLVFDPLRSGWLWEPLVVERPAVPRPVVVTPVVPPEPSSDAELPVVEFSFELRLPDGTREESDVEPFDALVVVAGLRSTTARPTTKSTTTTPVAASIRRERLSGMVLSPNNQSDHCRIACAQSFIERPSLPHRPTRTVARCPLTH